MTVEMAVTGTVVQIEQRMITDQLGYERHVTDMLLICNLEFGAHGQNAESEDQEGIPSAVLGARVMVDDEFALPELGEVKLGDLVYASGAWTAPGAHDMEQELRFVEAGRDWYSLQSWDAGEAGRLEVRAVEIDGNDLRRFVVREARWEQVTEAARLWEDPTFDDFGWIVHQMVVSGYWNENVSWDQDAADALDRDAEAGRRFKERQQNEEMKKKRLAERKAERKALAEAAKAPEVEAQKEAARQLAKRGRSGKGGKRKRRK